MPFVLSAPAKVTLTVLRGTRVVARLTTTRHKAGPGSLTSNGTVKQKFAPRGTYKLILQAVSPSGASVRKTAVVRIT